jgi:hypothetical protein
MLVQSLQNANFPKPLNKHMCSVLWFAYVKYSEVAHGSVWYRG